MIAPRIINSLLAFVESTANSEAAASGVLTHASYIIAAALFILSLKWLSSPRTARQGVIAGEIGMLLAVVGTLLKHNIVSYEWIIVGFVLGSLVGAPLAIFMPMTAVPQRTAISHAFGALAAALVGTAHYFLHRGNLSSLTMSILALEVLLGALTFTGSLMAFGKLQELLPSQPLTFKNQTIFNLALLGLAIILGALLAVHPGWVGLFPIFLVLSLAFGISLIMPIGGADMPTVIALLNSYAGLSASMMGFVLNNKLLIVAGALDGSSGFILAVIMCKAMNRSFTNVLFGAFGTVAESGKSSDAYGGKIKSATAEDVAILLDAARRVVIVPGYGMAVSQAQHAVRDLAVILEGRGIDVQYGIHPVAGRMPGHMNVLLAEANVPYDEVFELEDINSEFAQADVAFVIGANDVTNPAAEEDKSSPIYGMPVLQVWKAGTVMFIKRSLASGYAGIDNTLFYRDNTMMLLGDAKKMTEEIVKAS